MINREKVISIAKLANIIIPDEKIDKFVGQISAVLEYFEILKSIDTTSVEKKTHSIKTYNRFNEQSLSENTLKIADALSNGSDVDAKYFKTKTRFYEN